MSDISMSTNFAMQYISNYLNLMKSFSPNSFGMDFPNLNSIIDPYTSFQMSGLSNLNSMTNPYTSFQMPDFLNSNSTMSSPAGSQLPDTKYYEEMKAKQKAEEEALKAQEKERQINELKQEIVSNTEEIKSLNEGKASLKNELDKNTPSTKKLSFWGKVGSIGKGLLKNVTNLWTDKEGKFSWAKLGTSVAIGAGVVAACVIPVVGPVLTAGLIGVGAVMGGVQTFNGIVKASNAKTKEDEIKAYEDIGEGAGALALSITGAKSFFKARAASRAAKAESLAATLANELNKIDDINPNSIKNAINALKSAKGILKGNKKEAGNVISNVLKELETVLNPKDNIAIKTLIQKNANGNKSQLSNTIGDVLKELETLLNAKGTNPGNSNIKPELFENVIKALKNAKGNKNDINNALKDLKILSNTKGVNLPESEKTALDAINSLIPKNLNNAKNVLTNPLKIVKESESLTNLETAFNKLDDVKDISSIIGKLKNAASRNEALSILKQAKKLVETSTKFEKNEIGVLLNQLERQIITDTGFGTLVKSSLSKENLVTTAKNVGTSFKEYPYLKSLPMLGAAENTAIKVTKEITDEIEAEKQRKEAELQAKIDKLDEKSKEAEEKFEKDVKELAKLLDIDIEDKTIEELQEEIEAKTLAA